MSNRSVREQLEALVQPRLELANFNIEVNANIAAGNVDGVLTVTNENGEYPIVAALGCEPLSLLVERISALGGNANVFVKGKDGISFIIAERYTGKGHPVDLSDTDEWGSGMSDIDMFLDYLRLQCDGVIMPNRLPGDTELSLNLSSTSVQLEQTPALV